jgi:hypothetical protein
LSQRTIAMPLAGNFLLRQATAQESGSDDRLCAAAGSLVRHVRGRKMRRYSTLYDELSAAFQFPWYFGENSAALDECLSDLDWLPSPRGIVLSISDPLEVLVDESDDGAMSWFIRRLTYAQREWAETSETGVGSDRPATPFQVVISTESAMKQVAERWGSAGAVFMSENQ